MSQLTKVPAAPGAVGLSIDAWGPEAPGPLTAAAM